MNTNSHNDDNEELIHMKTIFRRHSKGPVMFNGCSPSGDVIIIENISATKEFDLTGWYIERQTDIKPVLLYTFLHRFVIPPLTTVELWSALATPIPFSRRNSRSTIICQYQNKIIIME